MIVTDGFHQVHPFNHSIPISADYDRATPPARTGHWNVRSFTSVGCYPVAYLTQGCETLCSSCVQDNIGDACDPESSTFIVNTFANWEDPDLYCDGCGSRIESAYAEIDGMDD